MRVSRRTLPHLSSLRARDDMGPGAVIAVLAISVSVAWSGVAKAESAAVAVVENTADTSATPAVALTVTSASKPTFQVYRLPGAARFAIELASTKVDGTVVIPNEILLLEDVTVDARGTGGASRIVLGFAGDVDYLAKIDGGSLILTFESLDPRSALVVRQTEKRALAAQKKAEEEKARAALTEQQRRAEDERIRLATLEREQKEAETRRAADLARQKAEEEARRVAELEKKKAEEEARRVAELEKKKAEEARRLAEIAEKKAEEEARRVAELEKKKAEEARRLAEIEKKKADEEARRLAEIEKKKAEEARRVAEIEKKKADEEARRLAEIERKKADEETRRLAEIERKKADEETRRLAELERQIKREEDARRLAEKERKKAEEEARRLAEFEKKKAEEEARRLADLEQKKAEEEARRVAEIEKKKREDDARRVAEIERKKAEDEARRVASLKVTPDDAASTTSTPVRQTPEQTRLRELFLAAERERQAALEDQRRRRSENDFGGDDPTLDLVPLQIEKSDDDDVAFGGSVDLSRRNLYQLTRAPRRDEGAFGGDDDDDEDDDAKEGYLSQVTVEKGHARQGRIGVRVDGGAKFAVTRRGDREIVLTLFDTRAANLSVRRIVDARGLGTAVQRVLPQVEEDDGSRVDLVIELSESAQVEVRQDDTMLWLDVG